MPNGRQQFRTVKAQQLALNFLDFDRHPVGVGVAFLFSATRADSPGCQPSPVSVLEIFAHMNSFLFGASLLLV
jgi:hypothetical protein